MRTIPLYGAKAAGRVALIDDGDYDLVMQYRWNVMERVRGPGRRPAGPYARVNVWVSKEKCIGILMHKLITGYAMTDHIDHDGLNNQRSNLREATHSQNMRNRRPDLDPASQYKGVAPAKSGNWHAMIGMDGRLQRLGTFEAEVDAALAYDAAASFLFGEYACLNFPEVEQQPLWVPPEPRQPAPCGTAAAYRRHLTHGEIADAECKKAAAKERKESRIRLDASRRAPQ